MRYFNDKHTTICTLISTSLMCGSYTNKQYKQN